MSSTEKIFHICDVCNVKFRFDWALAIHRTRHTTKNSTSAPICVKYNLRSKNSTIFSKSETFVSELQSSKRRSPKRQAVARGNPKRFLCDRCPKSYSRRALLKNHLRTTHVDKKPFECGMCSKFFAFKSHLEQHCLIHMKLNPFQCVECPKAFSTNWNLKLHMSTHTQDKPFSCRKCGKAFSRKGYLKKHDDRSRKNPELCSIYARKSKF